MGLDMRPRIKQMEDTANANGVTIYPIFPEGLTTSDTMEKGDMPLKGEYEPNPSGYERRNGVRGGPALSRSVRIAAGQRGFGCRPVRRRAGPSVMVPLTDV